MNGVRHFLLAVQFFTRVPVTGRLAEWVGFSPQMLRASAAHFPAVGWLVGAVGAAVFLVAQAGVPGFAGIMVAALLSTTATVLMTGAFHEDGLADLADGLGGSSDRARALEIMKDSRIGAFGAIALVLALGLKIALLASLAGQGAMAVAAALLGAHVLSRLAPLFVIRWMPYVGAVRAVGDVDVNGVGDAGAASKAKPLADAIDGRALWIGVLYAGPAAALLLLTHGPWQGTVGVLAGGIGTFCVARLLHRRLRGFTGDGLGATQQVCEIAIYLALAWRA